jgi:hypothetical protein
MYSAVTVKSRHTTPTSSEDDEKVSTTEDEKTSTGVTTMEFFRRTWQRSMLLNGKSLPAVYSYSDCPVFRHKVHIRFGEIHSWILYWNNWTLSKDPKQEQARSDLCLKNYGPMDRTLLEQECVEVFEEAFKDFPLAHVLFQKLDRGKSGSIVKLWQELLTEFPLDKKRATFEYLARAMHSAQTMSVNTDKEYTSYLSNVHEVTETLGQVTFNVKEVMFLMEMTNFQQSDHKLHKKIWASMEEILDEADDNDIPMDDIRRKNIKIFFLRKENLISSTRSRQLLLVRRCQTVVVAPYIVFISMGRDVISTLALFML